MTGPVLSRSPAQPFPQPMDSRSDPAPCLFHVVDLCQGAASVRGKAPPQALRRQRGQRRQLIQLPHILPQQPGSRLLGAVVEGEGGPWFFKATGPDATLAPQRLPFRGMLQRARLSK